jgi:hypothetical protein
MADAKTDMTPLFETVLSYGVNALLVSCPFSYLTSRLSSAAQDRCT